MVSWERLCCFLSLQTTRVVIFICQTFVYLKSLFYAVSGAGGIEVLLATLLLETLSVKQQAFKSHCPCWSSFVQLLTLWVYFESAFNLTKISSLQMFYLGSTNDFHNVSICVNDPLAKTHCQSHFIYVFIVWTSGSAAVIFWKKLYWNIHEMDSHGWTCMPLRISQNGTSIIYYQSSTLHIRWVIGDRLHYWGDYHLEPLSCSFPRPWTKLWIFLAGHNTDGKV